VSRVERALYFRAHACPQVYDDIEHRRPDVVASTAVRIAPIDDTNVRIVLHKNIGDEHVNAAIEKIKYVIGKVDRGRPG